MPFNVTSRLCTYVRTYVHKRDVNIKFNNTSHKMQTLIILERKCTEDIT